MSATSDGHTHVFLGTGHEKNERKTWAVIVLCGAMMVVEIVGGSLYGSLALVADGLHMSTHAGAMLIAALAYTYARRHAEDARFVFGTGKLGDLAGFSSAIVLAMIAALIGYEAIVRFLSPIPIRFAEAIPIAVVGLMVNIVSAWLLSGRRPRPRPRPWLPMTTVMVMVMVMVRITPGTNTGTSAGKLRPLRAPSICPSSSRARLRDFGWPLPRSRLPAA